MKLIQNAEGYTLGTPGTLDSVHIPFDAIEWALAHIARGEYSTVLWLHYDQHEFAEGLYTTYPQRPEPDYELMNIMGQEVRQRWAINAEHDDSLLESGAVYGKDNGDTCPNCGEPNFRAVGESKFECGNCDWYEEY